MKNVTIQDYNWPLMKNTLSFFDRFKLAQFILTSDRYTQGVEVSKFENEWSKWIEAKHSIFVTSGSTANFLLVSAIKEKFNLKYGDKVLVPACTWVTNINPIFQLGLTPIFCDVNLQNYSFDIQSMLEVKKQHHDIKAIFVTHLLGIPAPISEYKKIFPKAIFIDDVCESHGCFDENGKKIGSDSLGATFSFYFGHHMSTIEGGMISTNDSDLYDLMVLKRNHGLARSSVNFAKYANQNPEIDKSFLFVTDGYNFRNTELSAKLGQFQLKKLNKFIEVRRENYAEFVNIINSNSNFYPMKFNEGNSSFCLPFICKTKEIKKKMINLFDENHIEYRPIVGGNLLRQPYLKKYGKMMPNKDTINADILHENGVYIGNNQFVSKKDMKLLSRIITQLE